MKLPYVVSWQELKDLFRKAGSVQRANIILSREGHSKGHGIVLYATVADAQKAISEFDGYEWHGRKLEVREDRSAMDYPPPPPRTEGANSINQNEESDKATSTNGLPSSANSNDVNGISSNQTTVPTPVDYSITNNNEILNVNGTNINGTTNGVTTYNEEYTNNYSNHNSHNPHNSSTLQRQLFVGNLPFRVRWQDLKDLFREAGTVIRADVAMGYDNRSKGHGTVLFATLEEAKNAIAMFNQKNWQGRTLEVREDRGFVDPNIHNNINGNGHHHQHHHHHHLQDHSRRVIDPTNHSHTQNPYGPGGPVMGMGGLFYGPRVQAPQPNYAGRLLFVGNLPFNCQWQDLKDLFRNAGNIIRADVSTNFDGRSRGFGTVLFATPEDARNAVGMYDGYEFQGRTLRVHFDRFSLPLPPHHHNPPPHPAHLPPPVHPHHRPPPLISHHNFHIGPPPIPHHFLPPAHMGPFSPPLTTPSLTSPPFPVSYNHLAHLNNHPNANTNASSPFQPIQPIPIVSSAGSIHGIGTNSQQTSTQSSQSTQDQPISTPTTQFPGFGPIGKTNHSPQSSVTSTISNLGAVGAFPSNTTNGIANNNGISGTTDGNNNNYGSGNDNAIHGLTSTFASLHLSHLGQAPQLFFHPHPHHRHPVIPTAYHPHHHQVAAAVHHQQHHHHHQHSHGQHPHHHHHPGAIGSGLVGINAHIHNQVNGTSDSSVSITTTSGLGSVVNPPSSSSHITKETDNGSKNDIIGSSSTTTEVTNNSANNSNNSSNTSVPGLWDNSASTMLSTAAAVSNGPSGTVNSGSVISIGMTSSLTGMGGLDNPAVGVSPLYL